MTNRQPVVLSTLPKAPHTTEAPKPAAGHRSAAPPPLLSTVAATTQLLSTAAATPLVPTLTTTPFATRVPLAVPQAGRHVATAQDFPRLLGTSGMAAANLDPRIAMQGTRPPGNFSSQSVAPLEPSRTAAAVVAAPPGTWSGPFPAAEANCKHLSRQHSIGSSTNSEHSTGLGAPHVWTSSEPSSSLATPRPVAGSVTGTVAAAAAVLATQPTRLADATRATVHDDARAPLSGAASVSGILPPPGLSTLEHEGETKVLQSVMGALELASAQFPFVASVGHQRGSCKLKDCAKSRRQHCDEVGKRFVAGVETDFLGPPGPLVSFSC